jgi:hypothetical protein
MYRFDPATAEGGFPVELQGVNLTRDVSNQFFGLSQLADDAPLLDILKSTPGMKAAGVGVVVGAVLTLGFLKATGRL